MYKESIFLKNVPPNVEGRDFIVSDLNGCYNELMKLLEHVKFDKLKDRILSTGNLIGRGPKSIECLNLLKEEWFFSVLGNYEDMLINKINTYHSNHITPQEKAEIEIYMPYEMNLKTLPLIYEIEHLLYQNIYVVHGEIVPEHLFNLEGIQLNSKEYQRYITTMKKYDFSEQILNFINNHKEKDIEYSLKQKLIWSRRFLSEFYKEHKVFIDKNNYDFLNKKPKNQKTKIFCGHNIVPFPMKIYNQYYINTGAALAYPNVENDTYLFSALGSQTYALSLIDLTTGDSYGCISSEDGRGKVMKLGKSIYE